MRAAQGVRIVSRGGPPAFAPVTSLGGVESISPIRLPSLWSCLDVNDALLEVNAFENANDLIRPVTGMRPPFTRRTTPLDLEKYILSKFKAVPALQTVKQYPRANQSLNHLFALRVSALQPGEDRLPVGEGSNLICKT